MTRSLVLVAGSGRSGTSLLSGLLQRLGAHIPKPEVPADPSNPRGFAESQWVVDTHTRVLKTVGVQVSDARPAAWARTARACLDTGVQAEIGTFLAAQYDRADHVLIKDPRLSWFLPVWRGAAEDLGVTPRVIVMLRHPAAVVASKQRHYGGRQGEAARAAGWINQTLFTERATRDVERHFLRYEALLEDWTTALSTLDLDLVRHANAQAIRAAHEFLDVTLDRSRPDWEQLAVPTALQAQAEQVWDQATRLAAGAADPARLDEMRAAYAEYYAEAEAVAYSSIAAAERPATVPPPVRKVTQHIPVRVKRAVPKRVRLAFTGR